MVTRTAVGIAVAGLMALAYVTTRSGASPRRDVLSATTPSSQAGAAYWPDVVLRTQEGTRVRFYDDLIRGKVVLINFTFTSCTSQCPLTTANLVKVEEALGDRLGGDVRMISVTVDPETDTPDVLERYSRRYGTRPGWYFVTGSQKDVDLIRRRLGVLDDAVDKTQHTRMLVYGNEATGQWAATPAMAEPKAIARSVMRLLNRQRRG